MAMHGNDETLRRRNRAQFQAMLEWADRGWQPAAPGHRCRRCGGPQWSKLFDRGRVERFMCTGCGHVREVTVR